MAARKGARYLAPIALLATVAATYVVVHGQFHSHHATAVHRLPVHHVNARAATRPPAAPPPTNYTVKDGDTFSSISLKTHIPVSTLESLNSNVDPGALHTGQRLRLKG